MRERRRLERLGSRGGDGGPAGLGGSMESYGSLDADYPSGRDSMERVERGADDDDLDDDDDDDEVAGAIAASPAVATPRRQRERRSCGTGRARVAAPWGAHHPRLLDVRGLRHRASWRQRLRDRSA